MNTLSRTITGTIVTILGILVILGSTKELWEALIFGIPITIIGIYIIFNKKEDFIERIKKSRRKKNGQLIYYLNILFLLFQMKLEHLVLIHYLESLEFIHMLGKSMSLLMQINFYTIKRQKMDKF